METVSLIYLDNKERKNLLEQLQAIQFLKIEWTIKNASYVSQYQVLGKATYTIREVKTRLFSSHEESNTYEFKILAPCDGYLYIDDVLIYQGISSDESSSIFWDSDKPEIYEKKLQKIAFVFPSIQDLLFFHYNTDGAELETDPFTNTHKILWHKYRVISDDENTLRLDFISDNALFVFSTFEKLRKGDCVSLLLDGNQILDLLVQNEPTKINSWYECYFTLYLEDVEMLLRHPLVSYRITYLNNRLAPKTRPLPFPHLFSYSNEEIATYVRCYLNALKRLIPHYQLPQRTIAKTSLKSRFNWCYVYIMRDNTNGYHKIGISNKPEYREKTLQSEKPSIEMLACKKFPTRKIAEAIESALHTAYSQQRVRGEWFNLDDVDVAAIIETLK